jgi:hypothetical protein
MTTVSASNALQSGYQQLSSVMAKRNADQAEQTAKSLRLQADAAQAVADKEDAKAQSLNNQANRAKVDSDDAYLRLNLSNSFVQVGNQLANTMKNAAVKPAAYSTQNTAATSVANSENPVIGANIDTTA